MKYAAWMVLTIGCAVASASGCSSGDETTSTSSSSTGTMSSGSGGAGGGAAQVTPPPYGKPYDDLADWHLFTDDKAQVPADGVIAYEVNAPLFTDYTTKTRFLFVPTGKKIHYEADVAWDLPVGTALVKNFAMPADLRHPNDDLRVLETRILFHEPDGWTANTYVWDKDQKSATRNIVGPIITLTFKGEHGETVHDDYAVPNTNTCHECHGGLDPVTPLGPKTRQLQRTFDYGGSIGTKSQIDHYVDLGLFDGKVPAVSARTALVDPYGTANLDLRMRAYWDSNCAHCHNKRGASGNSGLLLDYLSTDPKQSGTNWGICKQPTATSTNCGDSFDVVPGQPDQSIMYCRVNQTGIGAMPAAGVALINAEGVALIKAWITSLAAKECGQ